MCGRYTEDGPGSWKVQDPGRSFSFTSEGQHAVALTRVGWSRDYESACWVVGVGAGGGWRGSSVFVNQKARQ